MSFTLSQKQCKICLLEKSTTNFGIYKEMSDGLNWACKACVKIRRKEYYNKNREKELLRHKIFKEKNPEARKNTLLKRKYGITYEQYLLMLKSQNYCCDICKKHKSTFRNGLVVDHNHRNNKVRALLCDSCNLALGLFKENLDTAKNLVEYIIKHSKMENN